MAKDIRNGDVLPLEIMARREEWNRGISVYMRQITVGMGVQIPKPVEWVIVEQENCYVEPMLRLGIQEAQKLMDELWQCGLRPTEGTGSAGSLAATERHLKDMQSVAMGLLRKQGVQV